MKTALYLFLAFAMPAAAASACDAIAFSAGSCYQAQAVYAQPVVQAYAAPQVSYYSQPQQVILPAQVTVTRPAYSLQIQQAYAAPVQQFAVKQYVAPLRVQKFAQPYAQAVVVKQFNSNAVVSARRGLFGSTVVREADGDVKRFNAFGRRVR